jgi:hypothetical protein
MNKDKITSQRCIFFQVHTKQRKIRKWVKEVNRFNIKSIYNLSWKDFYKELHKLGIKEFLKQYGYSCKKKLQRVIAKSKLSQKRISLYDFENRTEQMLFDRLGNIFFDKVTLRTNFSAKKHKLSTIHYYLYHHSLHFTAISLGFSSKQYFLNFFAQTLFVQTHYVPECAENRAQNLRASILSLYEADPVTLWKELADLYDKPLALNKNFIKYNYTLEELKLELENENTVLVVASLGGDSVYTVNKKLQTLRPFVNVSLQALKLQSWESLKVNTPIFIWKIKLYQLFSEKLPLEQWSALCSKSLRLNISFQGQFFTSERRDNTPLNPHSPPHLPLPSYAYRDSIESEHLAASIILQA